MTDHLGGGKRVYRPCVHIKFLHFAQNESVLGYRNLNSGHFVQITAPNVYWSSWDTGHPPQLSLLDFDALTERVYPQTDEQLYRQTKIDFMTDNEVDTLLNIVEAPQLPQSVSKLCKTVDKTVVRFRQQGRRFFKWRRLGELLREGASGHLAYSFGVAPLLSDIRTVCDEMLTVKKQLKQAAKVAGKVVSCHRTMFGTLNYIGMGPYTHNTYLTWQREGVAMAPPRKTCTVSGVRSHQYNMPIFQSVDYLMGRLGATGPASFVWERIPFSFVVDWFVDTRDVLANLDNVLTGVNRKITSAGISEYYTAQVNQRDLGHASGQPYDNHSHVNQVVCGSRIEHYHREAIADNLTIGGSSRFGKKQAALSASLLTVLLGGSKR